MSKPPLEFMQKYKIDSDEVWQVHAGSYAVKHAALERVAAEQKIAFAPPTMVETNGMERNVAILVVGRMGERTEWSIGEASPHNYRISGKQAAYPYAMAEKRAKDRVILKLLNSHGALYSDAEADEFTNGNGGEVKHVTLPKKDAKEIYTKMQAEVRECQSRDQLKAWMDANKDRIKVLPEDWQDILRLQCEEMLADLRNREAA
jgi:hypothetical protein